MAKQTILKATNMLLHWHDIEMANDFICGEYLPCFFSECNLICSFSSAFSSVFLKGHCLFGYCTKLFCYFQDQHESLHKQSLCIKFFPILNFCILIMKMPCHVGGTKLHLGVQWMQVHPLVTEVLSSCKWQKNCFQKCINNGEWLYHAVLSKCLIKIKYVGYSEV